MKLRNIIAAVALCFVAGTAFAQEEKPEYEFLPHAFLDVQGGAQYTLGEAKFKDLISPNVQLGIGYQITPWFAPRLQVNGWQSKGGWSAWKENGIEYAPKTYKFNYVAPGIDLIFDLTNAIGGFNPKRVVSVALFVGGGANIAWKNDEANAIATSLIGQPTYSGYQMEYLWDGTKVRAFGRGGLEVGFRVSDVVSIMLEGNANILSDRYNSKKAGNADWYFNALAGVRINLGKTYKVKEKPAPEPEPAPAPAPVVEKPKPAPAPVVQKVEPYRCDIFFQINKHVATAEELAKLDALKAYMDKYPKSKVSIVGYADKGTGSAAYNQKISSQRSAYIKDLLINKYGIDASRISEDYKGDTVQPFAENDANRVTICIAE